MGKEKVQFQLKTPKGTKDCKELYCSAWPPLTLTNFLGEGKDMVIRDRIFSTITQVFKRHGAVTIDTFAIPTIIECTNADTDQSSLRAQGNSFW